MTDVVARLGAALSDRYVIERELGAGGMATVYLAHDVRHDRKVALKVLRPELSAILGGERFLTEIKTTANLQHPHILGLFDSGEADGTVFYVMPYVDGESLRDRLTREKQLPVNEAVRIAKEVADALHYAHGHGIVHRDIKPENILLHGGHAMVADFGIALAASRSDGGTRMTETGMSLGTPHYMSPEQAMGEKEITPKADIYALGCVLYEMLTAEPPFIGATAQAIIARVMTEQPRSLTLQRHTIPPHIEAVVNKALEKLPADRFASAAEFAAALDQPGLLAPTRAHPAALALRPSVAKRVGFAGFCVAAGAAVTLGAVWLTRSAPAPHPVARMAVPLAGMFPIAAFTPTLAPDGSRLAFIAQDSARVNHVYLRPLDRETPVQVPGTDGTANSPNFSPDGQWIVFRQEGKLRKVNVAGGASLVIADVPGAIGGFSWGSRDIIAITHGDTLKQVPASGGALEVVLRPDSASGSQRFVAVHYLPDGRYALLGRITGSGPDIAVVDMDTREVQPLGLSGYSPSYVSAGFVVFVDQSGTLLTAPFDAGRRRVTGPAEPVAENVATSLGAFARYSSSRSGAVVYFTGIATERRQLVLVNRAGRVEPVDVPPAAYRTPRFSPDGRRLAVGIESPGRVIWGDVWEFNFASRRLTRLTFDEFNAAPEWSPDGRFLTFVRNSAATVSVFRVAADGSTDPAPLFERRGNRIFEARLMPDGRHLVFREDANLRDVLVAPVDSPAAARALAATAFNERAPAVSPDGRWVAFVSNLSGPSEVYVRRVEEGSPRWKVSTSGGIAPRWGPGGRELFYRSADSVYVVAARLGAEPQFGDPRALFGGQFVNSGNDIAWDVSPDGQRFAMVRALGVSETTHLHLILHHFDNLAGRGP